METPKSKSARMKLRNILILFIAISTYSCSEEYKMKKDFKGAYTGIMKDADSYELVSFKIFQNPHEYSKENEWFLSNYKTLKNINIERLKKCLTVFQK